MHHPAQHEFSGGTWPEPGEMTQLNGALLSHSSPPFVKILGADKLEHGKVPFERKTLQFSIRPSGRDEVNNLELLTDVLASSGLVVSIVASLIGKLTG